MIIAKAKNFYIVAIAIYSLALVYLLITILTGSWIINTTCLFKFTTSLPCPACGTTRSTLEILKGNLTQALQINPLGYLAILILLVTPILLLFDFLTQKKYTLYIYNKIEMILKKKFISIPLILLLVSNWIWNITKNL